MMYLQYYVPICSFFLNILYRLQITYLVLVKINRLEWTLSAWIYNEAAITVFQATQNLENIVV